MTPVQTALAVLIAPLASAALIALFLRRLGGLAAAISVLAATLIAAGAFALAFGGQRFSTSFEWLRFGSFSLSLGIKYDDLAALMLVIVGIVGLCVHVFSLGYLHDDKAKARYFGGLSIFMFSMIGIVLADNLLMMFIFWELVGFSSYVLINHWHERQTAADASKKAFIVNRVGDFGFLLGIIMCYWVHGTVNLDELAAQSVGGSFLFSRAIPLLLFCGAVGKSAQLPLQVWLPDAMEGPTPVSAQSMLLRWSPRVFSCSAESRSSWCRRRSRSSAGSAPSLPCTRPYAPSFRAISRRSWPIPLCPNSATWSPHSVLVRWVRVKARRKW